VQVQLDLGAQMMKILSLAISGPFQDLIFFLCFFRSVFLSDGPWKLLAYILLI
jgi:hypothetical protein